jgi:hypothetical protein
MSILAATILAIERENQIVALQDANRASASPMITKLKRTSRRYAGDFVSKVRDLANYSL